MTTLSLKAVLHQKISQIEDADLLAALQVIIDSSISVRKSKQQVPTHTSKRQFGFGKGTFIDVADDFDRPLEDFRG